MSPHKIERAAKVALLAFYRASLLEGDDRLSIEELAIRMGYKTRDRLAPPILCHMAMADWIVERGESVRLTGKGKAAARQFMDAN